MTKLVHLQKTYDRLQPVRLHDFTLLSDNRKKYISTFTRLVINNLRKVLTLGKILRT